jgi:diguanylate cyclase (GGDEF)-like protein
MSPDTDFMASTVAEIRKNYVELMPSSVAFSHIALAASVAVFWTHVDTTRLLIWAGIQVALLLTTSFASYRATPERFLPVRVGAEMVTSAGWAILPLVALADSADWQTLQGLLLLALMLSTLGNATAHREIHLAATIPISVISATVFAVQGSGAARWIGAGFAIALPFTIASGGVIRLVQSDLFASSLRNKRLAENLRSEGTQLQNANDQLEIANSDLDAQSRRDTLTGLYNRAGFLGLLTQAVADRPGKVVVCYLDLDAFKRVNDAFGHRFGDLILCAASRRISQVLRENEVLARQGGDELTIFGYIDDMEGGVKDLGQRILSVFDDPFLIEDRQIEVSVSIGLVWLPQFTTADDLMRFADTALYNAKDSGRDQFAVFNDAMRAELESRTQLQIDLGAALARSELTPYLQPIVDIATGQIAAGEALARWEHVDGIRAATDFIDTARDLGMLDRINELVVSEVFEFQRTIDTATGRPCPITVNVSPLHLDAMLNRVLGKPGVETIIFKITEDGIFSDIDRSRRQLERAKEAGIQVLLDDFGVGFWSLSVATQLPVDGFKIDRRTVAALAGNPSTIASVEAIIQLADRMGLKVVAEGVETSEQLALLRDLGVSFAQGYLFSAAVPMSRFAEWLRTGHRFPVDTEQKSAASLDAAR